MTDTEPWLDRLTGEELRRTMAFDRALRLRTEYGADRLKVEFVAGAAETIEAAMAVHAYLFGEDR